MNFVKWFRSEPHRDKYEADHPAFLAAREAWDASKKEWVGLTKQDAEQLVDDFDWYNDPVAFCFDVEAKLKEKNGG